jgi:hypothetical protein
MIKVKIKKTRMWVPAAGIAIALGFANNCLVLPYYDGGKEVDWFNLILAMSIILGLGGARDVVLRKFNYLGKVVEENQKRQSKGVFNNKVWIPSVGWFITAGLFHNCCIHPFFDVGLVEWSGLLSTLSILLTISGAREFGIYTADKKAMDQGLEADADSEPISEV